MKTVLAIIFTLILIKAEAQTSALAVADSLYAVGNYGAAIKAYENTTGLTDKVTLQLARSYKGLGIKSKALHLYRESLMANADQPIAATEYGQLLITTSNFIKADSLYSELTDRYPDNAGYYYQKGRALKGLERRKPDSSLNTMDTIVLKRSYFAFAKAVQIDSTHQKALYELALQHIKQRDYPEVERLTRRGIKNDSVDIEMINLSAQNVFNKGDYSKAIDRFEKLVTLGVENEFIHRKLGKSYYAQRYYELAREHYEKVLTYDDQDAETHLNLARLNNYLKNFEKATSHAKIALYLQDQPLDDIYYTMGRTHELHKKYPEAMIFLQKAIQENPNNVRYYHAMAINADNYYKDKKEVLKLYEQALEKAIVLKANKYLQQLISERIAVLKEEIFMQAEKE